MECKNGHTSLFQVLAADDSEQQTKKRVATRIAHKRVDEQFGGFVRAANDAADQEARLELIKEELDDLVTATCAEYEVEPKHVIEAVRSTLIPIAPVVASPVNWTQCPECSEELKAGQGNLAQECDNCGWVEGRDDDKDEDDHLARTASVHESRRPKLCPYHKEVMDISLAQGEPRAGYDAMAQHAWSSNHCQGGEYEGNKCNFKPEMTTESYWEEKAEKRQERREERERERTEIEQSEQLPEEQETPDVSVDEVEDAVPAETDNVVEVDFGSEPTEEVSEDAGVEAEVPMGMAASVDDRLPLAERTARACPECKGTGRDDSGSVPQSHAADCPKCHGEGTVDTGYNEPSDPLGFPDRGAHAAKTAEALETIDVTKGGETPIPKIDKGKVPKDGQPEIVTEGEGSPHPTKRKDPIEPIDYDYDERFEETDAVLEKQDVEKDTGPKPVSSSFASDDEVKSAIVSFKR